MPYMSADELIHMTQQYNRLRSIKRIVQIDEQRYELLYQSVVDKFAEIVQLMPASQAHHHAVPGGLFIHTLEVVEQALTLRQKYKLPMFATQEVQEAERHLWTYAIFVAAILHDVGKRLTLCRFVLKDKDKDKNIIEPFSANAEKLKGKQYQIIFHDSKYHALHEQIGLVFVGALLPKIAQDFLLPRLHIMREIMGYIHDDEATEGVIGKILKEADQLSTGQSLAHSSNRKFPGANAENIGERLMTQLRSLLAANYFVVNKINASIYTSGDFTYAVSKIMADSLRDTLSEAGIKDIPTDNNRIFDIFGEYGFAELNDKGQVMHFISREMGGNVQTFSVLKFQTAKLFRMLPQPFAGQIVEVSSKKAEPIFEKTNNQAIATITETVIPTTSPEPVLATSPSNLVETISHDAQEYNISHHTETATKIPKTETEKTYLAAVHTEVAQKIPISQTDYSNLPAKELLAEQFLDWLRDNFRSKKIIINASSGMVQKVRYKDREVIAVVTPRTFIEFGMTLGLEKHKRTAEIIQQSIHAKKLNIPAPRGQIHNYKIRKSQNNPLGGNAKICHYLFNIETLTQGNADIESIINGVKVNENLDEA